MKNLKVKILAHTVCIALFSYWLYMSGNLPYFTPHENKVIAIRQTTAPELSLITYAWSHVFFDCLRKTGFKIPYTHNERMAEISRLIISTINICNGVIEDNNERHMQNG